MYDLLVTTIGLAITKAVFKAWVKDQEIVSEIGGSLLDLLGQKISDARARSAASRQFSRIADKVAEALEPMIEHEFRSVDPAGKRASFHTTAEAIDSTAINARLLAALNYSDMNLSKVIMTRANLEALGEAEIQLTHRLIQDSSSLIIDLSSSLPGYTTQSFAEILQRETTIMEKVDSVIRELEAIRNQSQSIDQGAVASRFEALFRHSVARNLEEIELYGLDLPDSATRRQNLTTAYISLTVMPRVARAGIRDTDPQSLAAPIQYTAEPLRAEEAVTLADRMLIQGDAGSGKTTLLQYLAVKCATASFSEPMHEWNSLVPFMVRLRHFPRGDFPPPDQLPSLVAPAVSGMMPSGWAHCILADGRGLILVDGVDELAAARRDEVRTWLRDLVGSFPKCRYIVTSRPGTVGLKWLVNEGFAEADLLPMSPNDIQAFLDHWHSAVFQNEMSQARRDELHALCAQLKGRIQIDKPLRELATSPLLCAMICAMNRGRRQVLPSNRIALYEAAIEMLIHGRDEQRRISLDDLPALEFEVKRAMLQEVAFWFLQNGLSMADWDGVLGRIAAWLPRFPRLPSNTSADGVLRFLLQRSGIIRSPADKKIDFVHKTFQEFLAAKSVVAGDNFGMVLSHLSTDRWREVAIFAAGMANDVRRTQFIRDILASADRVPSRSSMYNLLAVGCLEACVELNPDLQQMIKDRIKIILPPRNMAEARALSAAGDMALPLLKPKRGQYAREAAACVRCLRLIGTSAALEVLADYAPDTRATVFNELIGAWAFFERSAFGRIVLSRTKGVNGALSIEYFVGLQGLRFARDIRSLAVFAWRGRKQIFDIHEIAHLVDLRALRIFLPMQLNLRDLTPLRQLRNLGLSCARVDEFALISEFEALGALELNCSEAVENLDEVCSLSALKMLELTDGAAGGSLGWIEGLSELESLRLRGKFGSSAIDMALKLPRLKALNFLGGAVEGDEAYSGVDSRLEQLSIFGVANLLNLERFSGCKRLSGLNLGRVRNLENLGGVSEFIGLKRVSITHCPKLDSIGPIANLPKLMEIYLSDLPMLKDLSPLVSLHQNTRIIVDPVLADRLAKLKVDVTIRG